MLKLLRLPLILALLCLTGCASTQDSLFNFGLKAERSMSDLTLKTLSVADHDWVYLDSETKQKPVVLLLHGFAVDKDNWLRFARLFDDYRVIAPDLPGHGETSFNPGYTYDFAQQAVWLNEFVEALSLNNLHIVGNSMGGGIALMYSYARPDRVRSITLVDAAGVLPPNKSEFQTIIDNGGKNPLIVNSKEDFIHLSEFAMEQQPFLPWPATNVLSRRAQLRNDINHKIFADIQAVAEEAKHSDDNLKMLQQIKEPVLIVWGEEDRVLDVSSVEVFEQYLPDSRSVIFPEVGHAPMLEIPQESAEVVLEFIGEVESRSVHLAGAE
ncbi:alpha/beta fold hydrolase [Bacterioplanoides sp. SCSIO 12839]|uniref:alpha/beta fold hydrolase n=1 Tax=Bacterioplanoides sp. SCSIO 12839 TaxID=2829569 RepID=UPI0021030B33|nr:alpha/beta hydrolase [Bacterioplanoides sp. SCSIO 12839]UTW49347.1 alpha/beta hydrolase [Bacterioplanoides sp. SCSIO 12839]